VVTQGRTPAKSDYAVNPVIVMEVLSRGSQRVHTAGTLTDYFTIPSVRHYLIVSANRRRAVHHRRLDDGEITTAPVTDGEISFEPPGLSITLDACYQLIGK
jgi:Uma2 family endonuclease